jgi:hypothetical protein
MFGLFNNKKKTVSLDRPVLVEGKDLRVKIDERKKYFDNQIKEFTDALVSKYSNCIEGTPKSDEKRTIQKHIHELELKKLWLDKLVTVLNDDYEYSLTISEGVTLGIIESVE